MTFTPKSPIQTHCIYWGEIPKCTIAKILKNSLHVQTYGKNGGESIETVKFDEENVGTISHIRTDWKYSGLGGKKVLLQCYYPWKFVKPHYPTISSKRTIAHIFKIIVLIRTHILLETDYFQMLQNS